MAENSGYEGGLNSRDWASILKDAKKRNSFSNLQSLGATTKIDNPENEGANTKTIIRPRDIAFKVWKLSPDSMAGIKTDDTSVLLWGGPKNAILVSNDFGVIVKGRTAFTGMPSDIQIGGLWKFNNQLLSTIPSTIMSPVSVLDFQLPMKNLFQFFRRLATDLGAFLA